MRAALSVIVVLLLAAASLACGSGGVDNGPMTIEQAREFDEFTLYWLGSAYQDLPVAEITRFKYGGEQGGLPANVVLIEYGADGRYSVRIEPYCDSPPDTATTQGEPDIDIRGALARRAGENTFRVWTGGVTISVSSSEGPEAARLAAIDLLPISDDGGGAPPIPPPRSGPC